MRLKKIMVSIMLFLAASSFLTAQEVEVNNSELLPMLCKGWEMEYAMMQGTQMKQKPGAANTEFEFKTDGSYLLLGNDGTKSIGSWRLNSEMNYVELLMKGQEVSRIKSIVADKLIMVLPPKENAPAQLSAIEIHFKRKV